jgi:tRNA pseudouridine55 synthase
MRGGVLVVDKPAGPTSFDVVQRIRRALRADRAGHTGTLDPAATGVLGVCVEDAVKLQRWLTEGDKAYEALVAFGAATDTEDAEGRVVARGDPSGLDAAAVRAALARFVGEVEQVPPMFSAVRVAGRRLHEAARAGEEVDRAPRTVRIDALELVRFAPAEGGIARATVAVRCGKGTYVRTLAADLGRALAVPAHLAALRRTAAGPFRIEEALPLEEALELGQRDPAALRARLIPPAAALAAFPAAALDADEARAICQGRTIRRPALPPGLMRALGPDGDLVAMGELREGLLCPIRVFASPGAFPSAPTAPGAPHPAASPPGPPLGPPPDGARNGVRRPEDDA